MKILLIILIPLSIHAQSFTQSLDSFSRNGIMYYCSEDRNLPIRNFWPRNYKNYQISDMRDTVYFLPFYSFRDSSVSRYTEKVARIYNIRDDRFSVTVPYPGLFKIKDSKGKIVLKRFIKRAELIYTSNLPVGYYKNYFNKECFSSFSKNRKDISN